MANTKIVDLPKEKQLARKKHIAEKKARGRYARDAIIKSGMTYQSLAQEIGVTRAALRNSVIDGLTEEYLLRVIQAMERRAVEVLIFCEAHRVKRLELAEAAPPPKAIRRDRAIPLRRRNFK